MAIKTNKSYKKRLKLTKGGKLVGRKSGQNHNNSKERHIAKSAKKGQAEFKMKNKTRSRYLVNL